jgi:hypothetical protein
MTERMQVLTKRSPGMIVLAVRADGCRLRDSPLIGAPLMDALADPALRASLGDALVVLDHAGPRAAAWSTERPLGAAAHLEALTARTPRALDDDGWRAITDAFVVASRACTDAGLSWALGLDDDGLLHDALRFAPSRAHAIVSACKPACVLMPVEDLAPRGLDATDGLALARSLVDAGVTRLIASAGSRALMPLRARAKGDTEGAALALVAAASSAAWLVGRVRASVEAVVPSVDVAPPVMEEVARALGLARIWVERPGYLSDAA